jgi:hypothetical protein
MNNEIDIRSDSARGERAHSGHPPPGRSHDPRQLGRYLGAHIPGARFVELPAADHLPFVGDQDAVLDPIEEFLTGVRPIVQPDRVLATVMAMEIVNAAERIATIGAARWRARGRA